MTLSPALPVLLTMFTGGAQDPAQDTLAIVHANVLSENGPGPLHAV